MPSFIVHSFMIAAALLTENLYSVQKGLEQE